MTTHELQLILPLVLRERDYILITSELHKLVTSVTDYTKLCHVENESGTINWKRETLPDCLPSQWRLWNIVDWRTTDNVRNRVRLEMDKLKQDIEAERQAHALLRGKVIAYFAGLGIPADVTERNMIGKLDYQQLKDLATGLKIQF